MYDFIILGSGTSGCVMAYYLTKAGYNCLMLEAGKYYKAKDFPLDEITYNAELLWNGGMDPSDDARYVFLRGKCVGGGSIINQCLLDRFDDIAIDDWKEKSGIEFFTSQELASHYDEIEKHIPLVKMEKKFWNRNAKLYKEGFENLGFQWAPLRRGQTDCATDKGQDCIVCLGGCHRDSKQSVAIVFLPEALKNGLELKTNFLVDKIQHTENEVTVYGQHEGKIEEIKANKCIIAGGTLGTNQILLKSGLKKDLPALGEGFFCHPQIMNFAVFDEPVDSHKGAFQSLKSEDSTMRKKGFKLENVFAQPIGVALLRPGFGKKHQEWMKKYRYMMCIEVAVRDVGRGRISLDKHNRLKIKKKTTKEDKKRANAGIETVHQIFQSLDAKEIFTAQFWFGLHLMGGCAIGKDPTTSVVNENFQVHGFKNLYIADSSIFPSAPGINPALTIMALSHRASQTIISKLKEESS